MDHSINDPETFGQSSEPASHLLIFGDFMGALQRLFRIGAYYPSGHVILDQATDRFLTLLVSIAQDKHFVRLEDDGHSLLLEKVKFDGGQSFVADFRRLMASLSITAIEINRDISRDDLLLFVRRLIAGRSLGVKSKQFASIEITDLPPAVTLTYKRFLTRESDVGDGRLDASSRNFTAFYEALAAHGLSEEQIDQCRMLLASLHAKRGKTPLKSHDLPSVNWDDVALLLAQAVQGKPLSTRSSSHGNLDILASILSDLEKETNDRKTREAINLLVSILKKPAVSEEEDKKGEEFLSGRRDQGGPKATSAQLQEFTDKNRLNPAILLRIQETPTEHETLSILLQVAQYKQSLQNQTRMLQFLNDIFTVAPNDKTWKILSNGLLAIVKGGDRTNLAVSVRLFSEPLRRLGQGDGLVLFLKTMPLCEETEEELLWPFAVNEILVSGSSGNIDTYRKLCIHLSSGLAWKDMVKCLPVLQSLEAFQRRQIAPDIFAGMVPSCYQLVAFLLRTSIGPLIGGSVVAGLKNSPADQLIKAVAPLLDLSIDEHKAFLDSYLRHPYKKEQSDGLRIMAGNIIVEQLTALPQEQRDQPWVPETIGAMAEFQGAKGRELLNQIIMNKRMLVIPEWPAACRRAAEEALKNMRRRPRTAKVSS